MMTMRNRVWPLCLAAFLFLAAVQAAFFPLGAAAETAPVAEATPLPADAESASPLQNRADRARRLVKRQQRCDEGIRNGHQPHRLAENRVSNERKRLD